MERIPLNQDITVKFDDHSFTIKDCIGQGNSSLVYKAEYIKAGVPVVLKEIYPVGLGISRNSDNSLSVLPKSKGAFDFYCKNSNDVFGNIGGFYNDPQTNNSTIFPFASGEANGTYYYASEWRAGDTLEKKLGEDKFSLADLIQVCKSIADTLQTYHDKKYIHTDIKPQNVFIRDNNTIMMFDFDSVFKMDQLRSGFISYSEDYAAPEVRYFPDEIDLNRTDIYSVGVILYKRLFGRLPEEYLYQPSFVPDYSKCEELQKYSPELKGILTKIFNGTLSLLIDDRYQTAKALAKDLGKAHKIAGKELFVTDMDIRPGDENLVERNEELIAIHKMLAEKKAVFITGLGGCGKTTLAQQYAAYYRDEYSVIQEVVFDDSLKETIENKLRISTSKDMSCEDKINHVLRMTSSDTLIIIDDVTLKESDGDVLKELLNISAPVRFIFTSREKWDGSLPNYICSYEADNYPDRFKDAAVKLFIDIAGEKSRSYEKEINEILNSYDYHLMTVRLLAVYANEVLSYDSNSFEEMLGVLLNGGISDSELYELSDEESVYYRIKNIFEKLFNFITEDDKYILQNASVLPHEGMIEKDFIEMLGVKANKFTGSKQLKELVRKSLLKREIINGIDHISMHPIIKELCQTEWILKDNFNYDIVFGNFIPNACKQILALRNDGWLPFNEKRLKISLLLKVVNELMILLNNPKAKNPVISETILLPITTIPGVYAEFDTIENEIRIISLLCELNISPRVRVCLNIHLGIAYGILIDVGEHSNNTEKDFSRTVKYVLNRSDENLKDYTNHLCRTDLASFYVFLAELFFEGEEVSFFEEKYDCFCKAFDLLSSETNVCERTLYELMRTGIGFSGLEYFDVDECIKYFEKAKSCAEMMDKKSGYAFNTHATYSNLIFEYILKGNILLQKQQSEDALMYLLAARTMWLMRFYDDYKIAETNNKGKEVHIDEVWCSIDIISYKYISYLIQTIYTYFGQPDESEACVNDCKNKIPFEDLLVYRMESTLFRKNDYVHAASMLILGTGCLKPSNDDNDIKQWVIIAYKLTSDYYHRLNCEGLAQLYKKRAKIIEEDFDNRVDAFKELPEI